MNLGLIELLPEIYESLKRDDWDSLVINRRKPHTTRLWRMFGDKRVCCHKFEPCTEDESFGHPHPWPAEFLILEGKYKQDIGFSIDRDSQPIWHFSSVLTNGSSYSILDELTWHKVTPLEITYTIMVNEKPFENPHKSVRTTKGKDLNKLSGVALYMYQDIFLSLISPLAADNCLLSS